MSQATKQALAAELVADLPHFTGTESYTNLRYPWLRKKFMLTDGANHLAEKAKAFWLMDAIASHQPNKKVAREPFQVWELVVSADCKAVLTCVVPAPFGGTDGDEHILVRQEILYSDFPLENISLYVSQDDELGGLVVMLTSEY
jgi:hypothetical protein